VAFKRKLQHALKHDYDQSDAVDHASDTQRLQSEEGRRLTFSTLSEDSNVTLSAYVVGGRDVLRQWDRNPTVSYNHCFMFVPITLFFLILTSLTVIMSPVLCLRFY